MTPLGEMDLNIGLGEDYEHGVGAQATASRPSACAWHSRGYRGLAPAGDSVTLPKKILYFAS